MRTRLRLHLHDKPAANERKLAAAVIEKGIDVFSVMNSLGIDSLSHMQRWLLVTTNFDGHEKDSTRLSLLSSNDDGSDDDDNDGDGRDDTEAEKDGGEEGSVKGRGWTGSDAEDDKG